MTAAVAIPDYSTLLPRPKRWRRVPSPFARHPDAVDLGAWVRLDGDKNPLRALVSVDLYDCAGGGHWLHLSVSRANRLPTWADLVLVREELGYEDLSFVQLLPPRRAWINVHSYCLHLMCRLDSDTVPVVLWDQEGADGAGYRAPGTMTGGRVT